MKNKFTLMTGLIFSVAISVSAQTISTFENITLAADTFWHGSLPSDGFASGNAYFASPYDTAWWYWSGGWAVSNQTDTTTTASDFTTQAFVAKAGSGYQSTNFSIGQNYAIARLTGIGTGGQVNGVWVTNSNYAYNSMKLGDSFAKQFGGSTGNDTDWFKLTIKNYYGGVLTGDSVDFYLADYRFSNNAQDYIVRNWTWVDLSSLGNSDSLLFTLSSTDNGSWGMNTPAFFCIDNLETADSPTAIPVNPATTFEAYPNPSSDFVTITGEQLPGSELSIYNSTGELIEKRIMYSTTESVGLSNFANGLYQFVITGESGNTSTQNIIKQ